MIAAWLEREKVAFRLWRFLPPAARDTMTAWGMGELTSRDHRLHNREVPTITVGELLDAMRIRG